MELINPEQYEGYCAHPVIDKKIRKVEKATIKPSVYSSGFDLNIYFEENKQFYSWSPSLRGAKQIFAIQCKKGSKWRG